MLLALLWITLPLAFITRRRWIWNISWVLCLGHVVLNAQVLGHALLQLPFVFLFTWILSKAILFLKNKLSKDS